MHRVLLPLKCLYLFEWGVLVVYGQEYFLLVALIVVEDQATQDRLPTSKGLRRIRTKYAWYFSKYGSLSWRFYISLYLLDSVDSISEISITSFACNSGERKASSGCCLPGMHCLFRRIITFLSEYILSRQKKKNVAPKLTVINFTHADSNL